MKKKVIAVVCTCVALFSMTACGSDTDTVQMQEQEKTIKVTEIADATSSESDTDAEIWKTPTESGADEQNPETVKEVQNPETPSEEKEVAEMILNIQAGDHLLTATLAQNSSVEALVEMLSEGTVTIRMSDYANMEKVGSLPDSLPGNDEQISTEAGDLILYQGNSFVIYYDTNSWNFTRLGKINDMTQQELKEILGDGDITVELSLSAT